MHESLSTFTSTSRDSTVLRGRGRLWEKEIDRQVPRPFHLPLPPLSLKQSRRQWSLMLLLSLSLLLLLSPSYRLTLDQHAPGDCEGQIFQRLRHSAQCHSMTLASSRIFDSSSRDYCETPWTPMSSRNFQPSVLFHLHDYSLCLSTI